MKKAFNNKLISNALETIKIKSFLSIKESPYDNIEVEAMFKLLKNEYPTAYTYTFLSFEHLTTELNDYIHWFNNIRINETLVYLTNI